MSARDGGPAFPVLRETMVGGEFNDRTLYDVSPGLSLRQWYAGQAVAGAAALRLHPHHIAKEALKIADALLESERAEAERENQQVRMQAPRLLKELVKARNVLRSLNNSDSVQMSDSKRGVVRIRLAAAEAALTAAGVADDREESAGDLPDEEAPCSSE